MAAKAPPSLSLVVEKEGIFSLDPHGKAWLMSLGNAEITVASIVGAYRTGKSAILSRLVPGSGGKNSFSVGHTVNACTKGIHMSTSLLENPADPNARILIIDTEGLGAPTAGRVHDTNIFVLTLLLSRVLMLNTKGTIDQTSLDTLRVVANIGNVLRASASPTIAAATSKRRKVEAAEDFAANEHALGELFPALVWIVRDFALELEDLHGRKITADQYLEIAIQDVAGQDDDDKNETRRALRKLFPKRTCITMCRPASDEETLKNINIQPDSAIDPRFLEQVEALRKTIFMYSKRTGMTGPILVSLAEKYCDAFNNKRVPVIRDVWDSISREQCQRAVDESVQLFHEHVNKQLSEIDTRPKLEALLSTAFDAAMQKFNEVAVGDNTAAALKELRKQANTASSEFRKMLQDRLTFAASTALQTLAVSQIHSIDHLISSVASLQNTFNAKYGKDPDTVNAWNQELVSRQLLWARDINEQTLKEMTEANAAAQMGLTLLTESYTQCTREIDLLRPVAARVTDVENQLAELKNVEESYAILVEKVRAQTVQDEHQRAELVTSNEQIQKLSTQIKKLETQRQQQIDDATKNMEQLRVHMESALDEVKESKDAAQERLQASQIVVVDLQKQLHNSKQELQTAKQSREELVAKFQHQLETTKADNAAIRQQRESELRLQIQKLESEKSMSERSLQTVTTDLASVRSTLTTKSELAGSLASELRNTQTRLTDMDTRLASTSTRLDICEASATKYRQTIENLEQKLATAEDGLRQIGQTHEAAMLKQKFRYEADQTRLEDALAAAGIARPAKRAA